jgi:hypothetical protein
VRWARSLPVPLYFLITTLLFTWPAALHLGHAVIGQLGDNMHFAWLMGWFNRAIFQEGRSPLFAPQLNYPEGWHLARSETTPLLAVLGLPITWLGGPLMAYNVIALLTFFLSGLSVYAWVRRLTGDRLASLLAGTLYAFLPFRIAHFLGGHLNMLGTMWFPLFFMGLFPLLGQGRIGRGETWLGGIGLGLICLTSQYYFYVTVVIAGLVAAAYLLFFARGRLRDRAFWSSGLRMGAVAAPLVALGVFPYLQLAAQDSLPDRPVESVSLGSASLTDFILPSTDHFLWGSWVGEHFAREHWMEGTLYVGVVAAGLGLVAVAGGRREQPAEVRLLGLLLAAGGIVALGTHLYWNEALVRAPLPAPLARALGQETTAVPMPGYFLYQFLPFYAKMRTFKRAGALVLLATSVLAGLGAAWMLKWVGGRQRTALGVGLLALTLIDFYPGPFREVTPVEPRPVDLWLATQPGQGAVAEFPFELQEEQSHVFYSLTHGKPILGGFFNAFPPPQYRRIRGIMEGFPSEASAELVRELGVAYVVVDRKRYPEYPTVDAGIRSLGFVPVMEDANETVYEPAGADSR